MLVHYGNSMAACGPPVGGKFVLSAIQRWLDRFCYKHPRFGIPNLMLVIVVGSALVWLLDQFSYGVSLSGLLAFSPYYILHGQIWRLITFVFVPMDNRLFFLVISLYFYYMIGSVLEREWGTAKFNVFYGLGVVLNIVVGFVLYAVSASAYPAGAAENDGLHHHPEMLHAEHAPGRLPNGGVRLGKDVIQCGSLRQPLFELSCFIPQCLVRESHHLIPHGLDLIHDRFNPFDLSLAVCAEYLV